MCEKNDDTTDWRAIHRYSRAEALADGVLMDVSETAKEAGIKLPTAVTSAVWAEYVQVPEGVSDQDEDGRLWDILWMLRFAIKRHQNDVFEIPFTLLVTNEKERAKLVTLKAVCGPGDDMEPVITIMLLDEVVTSNAWAAPRKHRARWSANERGLGERPEARRSEERA